VNDPSGTETQADWLSAGEREEITGKEVKFKISVKGEGDIFNIDLDGAKTLYHLGGKIFCHPEGIDSV